MNNSFTEGPIYRPLIKFALPILAALFLQTMYGAVDLLIVGMYASPADVSAVSTGSWLMQLVTVLVTGTATGSTILLGRSIGAKRPQLGTAIANNTIVLFLGMGIAFTIVLLGTIDQLTSLMHAPAEAYAQTGSYLGISAAGTLFIIAYNVLGAIFRGIGNSTIPFLTVLIACIFNVIGDYILVAKFNMAASGAAIATVVAQALSVVISLAIIKRHPLPFPFHFTKASIKLQEIMSIVKLGFPIAIQGVLVGISFLAIQAIVNALGVIPSAGVGIAEKLCGFIMLVPMSFSQSVASFTAQNLGAQKPERARKALLYSIGTSLLVGIIMGYTTFFYGDYMSMPFTTDPAVVQASFDYLKAYALDCFFVSFLFCLIGFFTGCGHTRFVMLQGIVGSFGVRIPVPYYMSTLEPVSIFKLGLATPASSLVQIIMCFIFFYYLKKYHWAKNVAA